jgi:RNA polymerase sigma factor (sigma-70 family)
LTVTAAVAFRNGTRVWNHVEPARLTMRPLSEAFVARYLDAAGDDALASVGGYQLEGIGAQLFARAAEGDSDAIAEVWRTNRCWIAAVLAAHAPRGTDVEDLLQEVAATLIAKSHHIRDAASLRGWLRVVAVNAARMAARSRSVESRAVRGFAFGRAGSVTRDAAEREARETLALLSRLPAHYAEPLMLQATQGLSQRQIAELLDVPETTVETRLARGRRMLRQILQELEMGEERMARRAGGRGDSA